MDDVYHEAIFFSRYIFNKKIPYCKDVEIQHGWYPKFLNCDPEFIIGSKGKSAELKKETIVHRFDQKTALENFGFKKVEAIGSPFLYVNLKFIRKPNSAILMPVHSIHGKQDFDYCTEFLKQVKNLMLPISIESIVLHGSTYEKIVKVNGFKESEVPIYLGADAHDWKTYARLAEYFQETEWVITNGIGSHIVYANFFGCKVLIIDPFVEMNFNHVKKFEFFQNIGDERTKFFVSLYSKKNLRCHFPFLFEPFNRTINHLDWAKKELGFDQKKTKEELIEIFGWNKKNSIKYFLFNTWVKTLPFIPVKIRKIIRSMKFSKK